ncbi:SubName: Full=Related to diacylglycerol pyrophosphate phosphatase DPP1 {ECO:0000313/EMBL:CCA74404.1} [Serendipita indica DSM 11827]|nr:SubName: Full=Related to diacylglycerol pyrophosphate phosphatase DPP1 {ECO:0000313/EMBL:CCA74404.1} [Serendipita indica DSM 11827]
MALFGKNKAANGTATTSRKTHVGNGRNFHLGTWLRLHGFDIITMVLAGVAGLGIYFAPPAYDHYFPIRFQDGEVIMPSIAVPMQKDLVPIWAAAFVAFFVPFVFFVLFQIRLRSMEHVFTSTMGLLKSLITAALFQVVIKCLIGGPRPHFLVVCKPQIPNGLVGSGYQELYFTRSVCTGDKKEINDAVESLPSGHSTAAFAGFVFLALYFNAQLKLLSAHNPAYWKILLFFAPILAAMLIALAMVMDGFHHWWDVTVGGLIGTACAFVAFRTTFASIWDFRFNHVLLPRTSSLFLRNKGGDANGMGIPSFGYVPGESGQWPVTRDGGWGDRQEVSGGAPFDASMTGGAGAGAGGLFGGSRNNGATANHNVNPSAMHHGDASRAV